MNQFGANSISRFGDCEKILKNSTIQPVGGSKNLTAEKAHQLTADNPDYAIRDLYNAIETGQIQIFEIKIEKFRRPSHLEILYPNYDLGTSK